MQPEPIEQIEARYKDEWLAIEVVETTKRGKPVKGVLIAHSSDREEVEQAAQASQAQFLILTYTGEVPYVLLEVQPHGNLEVQS
ncbi:MAG: hypothetical protein NZT92_20285 [Abditibacteriales bacterium]|nr:hypothetical protein [Abditibacteriales bacterium]MDW8367527.1 hypothetical protein [Abditibacteriales bacterium]